MELAKRITIFFAAMSVVALPLAAQTAKRGDQGVAPIAGKAAEAREADATTAVATLAGVGLALYLTSSGEEE